MTLDLPSQEGRGRHWSQALLSGRPVPLLFAVYLMETMNHFNDHVFVSVLATRELRAKSAATSSYCVRPQRMNCFIQLADLIHLRISLYLLIYISNPSVCCQKLDDIQSLSLRDPCWLMDMMSRICFRITQDREADGITDAARLAIRCMGLFGEQGGEGEWRCSRISGDSCITLRIY